MPTLTSSDISDDVYNFAQSHLLPNLELETVLFGILTMVLILDAYGALREGVFPITARTRGPTIARLVVSIGLYTLFTSNWAVSLHHSRDLLFNGWINKDDAVDAYTLSQLHLQYIFGPFILEGVLLGVFSTLVVIAVRIFAQKDLHSRLQRTMLSCTVLMYTISLAHYVLQTQFVAARFSNRDQAYQTRATEFIFELLPLILISVNVVLGDAIVLWRMIVLCEQHTYARALGAALLIGTTAASVLNIAKDLDVWGKSPIALDAFYDNSSSTSGYATATLALSLATNVISTATIGWRMWFHRRDIASHLGAFNRHSIAVKVMSVLVESGCVYCILWTLYLLESTLSRFDSVTGGIPVSAFSDGAIWFGRLMPQLTGIYPTIVLVLVALEQSYIETAFIQSSVSAFVTACPRSLEQGELPVYRVDARRSATDISHESCENVVREEARTNVISMPPKKAVAV
ncbi:unnamed protein product [Peniophora sp. CBMAI 1063]|nr:unnamed protein product [Peniophora sp. CBMAI 1063]